MKKSTLLLIVLVALLIATPAFAREHEPTGEPISLRCTNPDDSYCTGTQDYAANTAFYVGHGWLDMYPRLHPGHLKFELEVDGVYVQPTYVEFSADPDPESDGWFLDRTYFFNFPNGMTGTHTFEGHWILPCMFVLPTAKLQMQTPIGFTANGSSPSTRAPVPRWLVPGVCMSRPVWQEKWSSCFPQAGR